jgi:hypothetical protein
MESERCPHCGQTLPTRPIEDALRARIAELEAFKAGVPWGALVSMARDYASRHDENAMALQEFRQFHARHFPPAPRGAPVESTRP